MNTPTEKQKCIVEQWLYGLKVRGMGCFNPDTEEIYVMKIVDMDITDNNLSAMIIIHDGFYGKVDVSYLSVEDEITPILRSLSDLTKEITHKGYNNDEPFVPLVELAKKTYLDVDAFYTVEQQSEAWGVIDVVKLRDVDTNEVFSGYVLDKEDVKTKESDLLHLWHFDTRNLISRGGAIDVNTLEVNPYEV
ncbi:MAG: hypothetical protein RR293_07750 [Bacteroidales bacterium]